MTAVAEKPPKRTWRRWLSVRLLPARSSALLRGILTLSWGSALARLIGLASLPILTRVYMPEEFGVFGVYTSLVLLLLPLAGLCYTGALPLPRHDRTAAALLGLSLGLTVVFCLLLAAIMAVWGPAMAQLSGQDLIAPYLLLLPASLFIAGAFEALTMWNTRQRSYATIARAQIWQALAGEGSKLAAGAFGVGATGLIGGHLGGQAAGALRLSSRHWRDLHHHLSRLGLSKLKRVAWRYRGFPINRVPARFLLALGMQLPMLLTAAYFDANTTGQMAIATVCFALPFALFGQATSRAFYGEMAKLGAAKAGEIRTQMHRVIWTTGLLALPVSAGLVLFAEPLAVFVLGEEWQQAGRFIAYLAIALVPQFVSATVIRSLDVLEAHRLVILLHLTRSVLVFGAFSIAHWQGAAAETTILVYACTLATHYLAQCLIIDRALRRKHAGSPP